MAYITYAASRVLYV